ncbi:MAG: hypothetical protein AAF367_06645, partial [Pseudomonadota bacterium]
MKTDLTTMLYGSSLLTGSLTATTGADVASAPFSPLPARRSEAKKVGDGAADSLRGTPDDDRLIGRGGA